MAVSEIGAFGKWATFDNIPNVDYVRNILAVTPEFKDNIRYVQKIIIPKGTRVQIGTVGPQKYNGRLYPGGGTQIELLEKVELIPVGKPIPIY